jgi:hypothetical protein
MLRATWKKKRIKEKKLKKEKGKPPFSLNAKRD